MSFEVTDNQTGKIIIFENQPTDADLNEAFGITRETLQTKPKSVQEKSRATVLDIAAGAIETPLALATSIPAWGLGMIGGIAKTVTSGDVAGKKTREDITNALTYQPRSESGKGAMDIVSKVTYPLALPRKVATAIGGEQWGNVADVAMVGLLPKIPGALREAGKIPYKTGRILYRKTLQPAGDVAETKAITTTGYEPPISGKGGWAGFKERFKTYGSTMENRKTFYKDLGNIQREAGQIISKNEGKTVKLEKMIAPLDELINRYAKNTELPETHSNALLRIKRQVTRRWLTDYPDGNIPIREAQHFKTTLYKRAENAYGELQKSMTPEARKALAHGAMEELETVMPEIGPVNRRMKPLLEFEEALDKSIVRIKNEKFSITNTIFNNDYLLGKLAKVFKALSPKHPLASPESVKAYLFAKKNVNFEEVFPTKVNPNQIGYKPQINLGMEDVSGKPSSYTPPLVQPTLRAIEFNRATTPINLGMLDESSVKSIKGTYNNPVFWSKNKDLTSLRLKLKNKQPMVGDEWNTLLERIMMYKMGSKPNPNRPLK